MCADGVIGEAVLAGMREVQALRGQNGVEAAAAANANALWAKLYSRFLRSLVPSMMILLDSPEGSGAAGNAQEFSAPNNSDQSMTMSADLTAAVPPCRCDCSLYADDAGAGFMV